MKKRIPRYQNRDSRAIATPAYKSRAAEPSKRPVTKGPSPIPTKREGEFPMRINKYLAWKGYATRRAADDLINKKMVTINGRFAVLGDKVEATDAVELRKSRKVETFLYYAYNKPRGIATEPTRKGNMDISRSIPLKGVFPVGGLDTNAEGLIILTNDRRIIDRLLNPIRAHMKEFRISTRSPVRANFKEKMEAGVMVNGEGPINCSVKMLRDNLFTIRVTDSGSHLRHMCSMFFAEVDRLVRTQILNIKLGNLAPNSYRLIEGDELQEFLNRLGL